MEETLRTLLPAFPWIGLALVGALAWLEYVLPPMPGDSSMLLAAFLGGTGVIPLWPTAGVCLVGSIAGAMTAYGIGARTGRSYFFLRSSWARSELDRLERAFARYGTPLLLINRFLPVLRGVFLYAAGIGKLPRGSVLAYSTVSNLLWVALVMTVGSRLGSSWDEVQSLFRRYVWAIGLLGVVYVAVWWFARRRRTAAVG